MPGLPCPQDRGKDPVKSLDTRCDQRELTDLSAGELILLCGPVLACRDRAHRRMAEILEQGASLPFDLPGTALFYAAPTPAPPGRVCGSVGPTTSLRMDPFTLPVIRAGVRIFIGKGPRGLRVSQTLADSGSVYLAAPGGTAALGGRCVERCGILAWEDLGAEAVYSMVLRDYPVFVALDARGGSIYGGGTADESHRTC